MERLELSFGAKGFPSFIGPRSWRQEPLLIILIYVIYVKCLHIGTTYAETILLILALAGSVQVLLVGTTKLTWNIVFVRRWKNLRFFLGRMVVGEPLRSLKSSTLIARAIILLECSFLVVEQSLCWCFGCRESVSLGERKVLLCS